MASLVAVRRKIKTLVLGCVPVLPGLFLLVLSAPVGGTEPDAVGGVTKEVLEREFGKGKWNFKEPVDIGSKRMSVDLDSHTVVFEGEVSVKQGELHLMAREVTAVFGSDVNDILQIVAKGDVSVRKADKLAFGQEAVYDRSKATILLTGDPYLKHGENFIRGERILVRLDEERMEVQGDVQAEFRPVKERETSGENPAGGSPLRE